MQPPRFSTEELETWKPMEELDHNGFPEAVLIRGGIPGGRQRTRVSGLA
jgi:hypothetical protein